ncbi:hypothetical protein GE21DRAFT_8668 [Neurospora crassa]|uniref:Uncharacterized protein n=1 Tax=Neurospora crassa (strain ATCC 24698 / 74-OR23-1A / CBS 708.71 / DSM 1257 / FGSC 987) TaxID=367110 RepID=Q7S5W7_NEUCR|nr:hypothetical protein NCU04701 [Neurospora crassa OR74A]EAA30928.2 hypothetical protein NCU04701 [Neurospora crassa OR74A]KHE81916.1 hypothetical protein GE21DRAFT_8668 [Neurospora crassa]|eukprot:XP_960164.2 hypothetical protein NCU04701 [Neurospora crassa OR74A]
MLENSRTGVLEDWWSRPQVNAVVTTLQSIQPSSKRAANTTKPDSAAKKSTRLSPKTKDEIPDRAFPPPQRQPNPRLKRSKKDTVELGSRSIEQLFNAIPPTIAATGPIWALELLSIWFEKIGARPAVYVGSGTCSTISDSEEDFDSSSSAASPTPTLNRLTDIRAFTTLVWEAGLQQIFKCPSKHDNFIQLANDKDFVPSFELGHPDGLVKPESQVFFLSRGMDTPLQLPNGQVVFPSSGIPPMKVHRVHLAHGKRLAGRVEALTNKCLMLVTEQPEDATTTFGAEDRPKGLGPVLVRGLQFLAQDVQEYLRDIFRSWGY